MKNVKSTMAAFCNCYVVKKNPSLYRNFTERFLNKMFLAPKRPLPIRLAQNPLVPK